MKRNITHIATTCCLFALLAILNSCNDTDDVIDIFVGKTWKMSFIASEGNHKQFDFWNGDNNARQRSMNELAKETTYTLNFEGTDLGGDAGGTFNGKAITASIDGKWSANGGSNNLTTSNIRVNLSESDVLAKAFIFGIQNAFRYDGDKNNLFIYYKEGSTIKFIGLTPLKEGK